MGTNETIQNSGLNTLQIVLIAVAAALFLAIVIYEIVRFYKQKAIREEEKSREVEPVNIKHGVRYTEDQTVVTKQGNMNITFDKNDFILKQNVTYVADHKGELKPGKYVVLSPSGGEEAFNIRIGKFVKEYKHNQKIIITEGTEVTSVSGNVILR